MKSLVVALTADQIEQLGEAYGLLTQMEKDGEPGMLLAQIFGDHMRVGVLSNERAVSVQVALGTTSRPVTRSAFDKPRPTSN